MHPDNKRYLIWLCSLMSQLKGACSSTRNEARRADCLQISRRRPLEALEHVQKKEKKGEQEKKRLASKRRRVYAHPPCLAVAGIVSRVERRIVAFIVQDESEMSSDDRLP